MPSAPGPRQRGGGAPSRSCEHDTCNQVRPDLLATEAGKERCLHNSEDEASHTKHSSRAGPNSLFFSPLHFFRIWYSRFLQLESKTRQKPAPLTSKSGWWAVGGFTHVVHIYLATDYPVYATSSKPATDLDHSSQRSVRQNPVKTSEARLEPR